MRTSSSSSELLRGYSLVGSPWSTSSDSWWLPKRQILLLLYHFLVITWQTFQFFFLISFLNIIDLLGILPFYASLLLTLLNSRYSIEYIAKAAQVRQKYNKKYVLMESFFPQIFRILRILRIFKLSRHITGLKTLGTTLRNSHRLISLGLIVVL